MADFRNTGPPAAAGMAREFRDRQSEVNPLEVFLLLGALVLVVWFLWIAGQLLAPDGPWRHVRVPASFSGNLSARPTVLDGFRLCNLWRWAVVVAPENPLRVFRRAALVGKVIRQSKGWVRKSAWRLLPPGLLRSKEPFSSEKAETTEHTSLTLPSQPASALKVPAVSENDSPESGAIQVIWLKSVPNEKAPFHVTGLAALTRSKFTRYAVCTPQAG